MAHRGKKYQEVSKLVDRERSTLLDEAAESSPGRPTVASTRRPRPPCALGWTRVTPTRWSAAQWFCRMAPARRFRVIASLAQGEKAQEALKAGADEVGGVTWSRRSRQAGSTSTSRSRRRT